MSEAGRVGWAQQKKNIGQHLAPIQRIFDFTDAFFSRRHAGHDLGVENTRIGPKRPYLPRFVFYVGVLFPPLISGGGFVRSPTGALTTPNKA